MDCHRQQIMAGLKFYMRFVKITNCGLRLEIPFLISIMCVNDTIRKSGFIGNVVLLSVLCEMLKF